MLPPGSFEGRVAIVRGGGTGIGHAVSRQLAGLGADLVLAGRREEPLGQAARPHQAGGAGALAPATDL